MRITIFKQNIQLIQVYELVKGKDRKDEEGAPENSNIQLLERAGQLGECGVTKGTN